MQTKPTHLSSVTLADSPDDERAALVRRVASSQTFQKSPKLREFLQFVCECSLRHAAIEEVKEQQIGVHVFHRRPDYNPSEDSIVRVQARELRKRLATYFETEGRHESLIIEIPKGAYLPVFLPMGHDKPISKGEEPPRELNVEPAPPREVLTESPGPARSTRSLQVYALIFGVVALFGSGWILGNRSNKSRSPGLAAAPNHQDYGFYESLLGPVGHPGDETLLVLSNPRVLLYSHQGTFIDPAPNALIQVPADLRKSLSRARNLGEDPNIPAYLTIDDNGYTGVGEAASAYSVGRLMELLGRSVRLTQGRFLNWDAARRENLIVLGNPDINSWTRDNLAPTHFAFATNGIRSLDSRDGEASLYSVSHDPAGSVVQDYAVIRMATTASGSRVLTLAGRTSSGTYGAGDFFARSDKMRQVYDKLMAISARNPFPSNWEVLIKVEVRDNIPVDTALVAVKIDNLSR